MQQQMHLKQRVSASAFPLRLSTDAGASFTEAPRGAPSQPPPPSSKSDLDPPKSAMWLGRFLGVCFGVAVAVQLVTFIKRKQRSSEEADASKAAALNGPAPGAPSVPAMDYRVHTMSAIFQSVLAPLEEFDRRADVFTERKALSEARIAEVARRRKLGPVDAAEAKATEIRGIRIAAEERTVFAPRLEYLRELYRVRSLELMQRSQFNGERLVASLGSDSDSSTTSANGNGTPSASSSDNKSLVEEIQSEQAAFQTLAKNNQHLAAIANKYGLKGPTSAARIMQPTTERQQQ